MQSWIHVIEWRANVRPELTALVDDRGAAYTYAQLRAETERRAEGWAGLGLGSGDVVAVVAKNSADFLLHAFALMRAGATPAFVNWRLSPRELAVLAANEFFAGWSADPSRIYVVAWNGLLDVLELIGFHGADGAGHPLELANPRAAGWAVAGDCPFQWTKQVPSDYGGTRNAMIVHWPKGIKAKGEVRTQWHHVIDVGPTVLEAAGLPQPTSVNGTVQEPIEGVSMLYSFNNEKAPSTHHTQYFEIFGNRAIYNDGWFAGTIHRAAWEQLPRRPLKEDIWELYDTSKDFSLANNVAAQNPEKLKEMVTKWEAWAKRTNVLPWIWKPDYVPVGK